MKNKYIITAIFAMVVGSLISLKANAENTAYHDAGSYFSAHFIGSDSIGTQHHIYTNSIGEYGEFRRYWVLEDARNNNTGNNRTQRVLRTVDCLNKYIMTDAKIMSFPNEDHRDISYEPNAIMTPVVPGTVGELEINYVCEID